MALLPSGAIKFSDLQTKYNEIHQTLISDPTTAPPGAIKLSHFNGKYLASSATALAIGTSSPKNMGAFRAQRFANSQILSASSTATTKLVAGEVTRFRIRVSAANYTFKVTLQGVVNLANYTLDCKIGLANATDVVLFNLTDSDFESLEYTASTGKLYIYGVSGKPSTGGTSNDGSIATLSTNNPSSYSSTATDFVLQVGGYNSSYAGPFTIVRDVDVLVQTSSSSVTCLLTFRDTWGDGYNNGGSNDAGIYVRTTTSTPTYYPFDISTKSDTSNPAPIGFYNITTTSPNVSNAGVYLTSACGQNIDYTVRINLPASTTLVVETRVDDYGSEYRWSLKIVGGSTNKAALSSPLSNTPNYRAVISASFTV